MNHQLKICLDLAEQVKEKIRNETAKELVEEAIELCRGWMKNGGTIADRLYNFLDNEEDGFTVFQEAEKDPKTIAAWDVVIDALAIICRNAYVEEAAAYFPEPIEAVDVKTISHMIDSYLNCGGEEEEVEKLWREE